MLRLGEFPRELDDTSRHPPVYYATLQIVHGVGTEAATCAGVVYITIPYMPWPRVCRHPLEPMLEEYFSHIRL